jgi:hypothetical protein
MPDLIGTDSSIPRFLLAMFDLLDRFLLQRCVPDDDGAVEAPHVGGSGRAPAVISFLPWNTSLNFARRVGLFDDRHFACFETPSAVASANPARCVLALETLVAKAEAQVHRARLDPCELWIIGYSLGTYPATVLANRLGSLLYAVTPADRGDLMMWESDAALKIKQRARARGFELCDFTRAMKGYHPIENLADLASGSTFIVGLTDPFVPAERRQSLLDGVRGMSQSARIIEMPGGHVRTLVHGARYIHRELSEALTKAGKRPSKANASPDPAMPYGTACIGPLLSRTDCTPQRVHCMSGDLQPRAGVELGMRSQSETAPLAQ